VRAAIEAEYLKLRRARTVAVASAVLVVGIPALVAGFLRATVSSPQSQLSAKVRAMVSGTGWAAYLGLADQVAAVAVLLGVGIVVAWCFGRAFADHTLVSVYALPISRGTIAAAKAVVVGAWAAGVSLLVTLVLLLAGPLAGVGLPDGEAARGAPRTLAVIVLTAVLALTLALPASLGRGYLPAMGALLLVVLLTQILVTLGTGAWLPYAAPALWSQTSVPVDVTPVQLALVPVFAGAVLWVTLRWWQRMEVS
jgi:ABC-2 type transport system permease protein